MSSEISFGTNPIGYPRDINSQNNDKFESIKCLSYESNGVEDLALKIINFCNVKTLNIYGIDCPIDSLAFFGVICLSLIYYKKNSSKINYYINYKDGYFSNYKLFKCGEVGVYNILKSCYILEEYKREFLVCRNIKLSDDVDSLLDRNIFSSSRGANSVIAFLEDTFNKYMKPGNKKVSKCVFNNLVFYSIMYHSYNVPELIEKASLGGLKIQQRNVYSLILRKCNLTPFIRERLNKFFSYRFPGCFDRFSGGQSISEETLAPILPCPSGLPSRSESDSKQEPKEKSSKRKFDSSQFDEEGSLSNPSGSETIGPHGLSYKSESDSKEERIVEEPTTKNKSIAVETRKKAKKMEINLLLATEMGTLPEEPFLILEQEVNEYVQFKNFLVAEAEKQGRTVVKYSDPLLRRSVEIAYISTFNSSGRLIRGLFAKETIEEGMIIAPYEGSCLSSKEFYELNEVVWKNRIVTLSEEHFRNIYSNGNEKYKKVEILSNSKTNQDDLDGLTGEILSEDSNGNAEIQLYGKYDAQHTLTLAKNFIDSEIVVSKHQKSFPQAAGKKYIMGVGALANSDDPRYGDDGLSSNTVYMICNGSRQAFLVATKKIEKGSQVLVSYKIPQKFSSLKKLLAALREDQHHFVI